MKFKPITAKYHFDAALTRHYPEYLTRPTSSWIQEVLRRDSVLQSDYERSYVDSDFINTLNLYFRESFPQDAQNFLSFVFEDSDRTTNMLGFLLQNLALYSAAQQLENILSIGGSAYAVMPMAPNVDWFEVGKADLVERVPTVVLEASQAALDSESLIREAWHACYSKNPDYEKVVSRCCDILEKLFQGKFFPNDGKPQIKKFVHAFKGDPGKLVYKGSTIVNPENLFTDLAEKFSDIRGQHSAGNGRKPTKDEADFVLHYTIFAWNMLR